MLRERNLTVRVGIYIVIIIFFAMIMIDGIGSMQGLSDAQDMNKALDLQRLGPSVGILFFIEDIQECD